MLKKKCLVAKNRRRYSRGRTSETRGDTEMPGGDAFTATPPATLVYTESAPAMQWRREARRRPFSGMRTRSYRDPSRMESVAENTRRRNQRRSSPDRRRAKRNRSSQKVRKLVSIRLVPGETSEKAVRWKQPVLAPSFASKVMNGRP